MLLFNVELDIGTSSGLAGESEFLLILYSTELLLASDGSFGTKLTTNEPDKKREWNGKEKSAGVKRQNRVALQLGEHEGITDTVPKGMEAAGRWMAIKHSRTAL